MSSVNIDQPQKWVAECMAEVSAILEGESNEWVRHVYELASHQTSMPWLFLLLFSENELKVHV